YRPSFAETETPVSGIFPPAFTPAKMVPVPFTKLNEPSPNHPTHTTSLFEATSTPSCSQFDDTFTKSPSLPENFIPLRNGAQAGELGSVPSSTFGFSLGGAESQCEYRRYVVHSASGLSRKM